MNTNSVKLSLIGDIVVPEKFTGIEYGFSDLILGNLEAPICRPLKSQQKLKAGPHLVSYPIPDVFKNKSVFNLANNHMMDYGKEGLEQTLDHCRKNNIQVVGAGKNKDEAQKSVIIEKNGIKIGVLAACETQFGIATRNEHGVSDLNPAIYKSIQQLKNDVDIVIVSIHAAAEMCPWPSPQCRELLRSFIDQGATIIHSHHAHVPQGYEEYNQGLIFYGLGNFLVSPKKWRAYPNTLRSIVAEVTVTIQGIKHLEINFVNITEDKAGVGVSFQMSSTQKDDEYWGWAVKPLHNDELLMGLWQEFSVRLYKSMYADWLGFENEAVKSVFKKQAVRFFMDLEKFGPKIFNKKVSDVIKKKRLLWYHLFACESHRVCISTALGVLGGELNDFRDKESKEIVDKMIPWLP